MYLHFFVRNIFSAYFPHKTCLCYNMIFISILFSLFPLRNILEKLCILQDWLLKQSCEKSQLLFIMNLWIRFVKQRTIILNIYEMLQRIWKKLIKSRKFFIVILFVFVFFFSVYSKFGVSFDVHVQVHDVELTSIMMKRISWFTVIDWVRGKHVNWLTCRWKGCPRPKTTF